MLLVSTCTDVSRLLSIKLVVVYVTWNISIYQFFTAEYRVANFFSYKFYKNVCFWAQAFWWKHVCLVCFIQIVKQKLSNLFKWFVKNKFHITITSKNVALWKPNCFSVFSLQVFRYFYFSMIEMLTILDRFTSTSLFFQLFWK